MVRINKYLSQCNLGSRRYVETLIQSGKISVNGETCFDYSRQVNPDTDSVFFQSKKLKPSGEKFYIMLNKPVNYLVTAKDDFGRKTVFTLIPEFDAHMFPIGRLDLRSEGLLLLSNDGDFSNEIIHPRFKLPKIYKVKVKGYLTKQQITPLREGILIDNKKTLPAAVYVKKRSAGSTTLRITIHEGRKRQIRRMIKAVDSEVLSLKRLQIGNLKLGKLPLGRWRFLTGKEIQKLRSYSKGKS